MKSKAVFTVCNIAYLPRALVLANSIDKHENLPLHIFIFDHKRHLPELPSYVILHWPEEFFTEQDLSLAFKYDVIEFTTALKPSITLSLLNDYNSVIFLDPDTRIFTPLDLIWESFSSSSSVLLTPHYLTPQPDNDAESDTAMMRFGSFNLGFYAVTRSPDSLSFLKWWEKRCKRLCYMESQYGLSTDQKWISIAPCLFSCISIMYDRSLNVAPWNLFERTVVIHEGFFSIDNKPIIFFHFSNFDHSDLQYRKCRASNCELDDWPYLDNICSLYSKELMNESLRLASVDSKYSFEYFYNGHYITPLLRRAYASNLSFFSGIVDPFSSDKVVSFAKHNNLLSKGNKKYMMRKNLLNTKSQFSGIFTTCYFFMRIILRLLGPNKFFDFLKGLVILSLVRKHPGLWKH